MAFPIVASVESSTSGADVNNIVSLPSGINEGDLLIALVSSGFSNEIVTYSGWTLEKENSTSRSTRCFVLSRIADGTEGSSATFVFNESITYVNLVYKIKNHQGIEVSNFVNSTLDAPSLSPEWGEADTLWLVLGVNSGSVFNTIDSAPTNYSNFNKEEETSINLQIASAERFIRTGTENPGAFGSSGDTDEQSVATLAIKGKANTGNFLAFM